MDDRPMQHRRERRAPVGRITADLLVILAVALSLVAVAATLVLLLVRRDDGSPFDRRLLKLVLPAEASGSTHRLDELILEVDQRAGASVEVFALEAMRSADVLEDPPPRMVFSTSVDGDFIVLEDRMTAAMGEGENDAIAFECRLTSRCRPRPLLTRESGEVTVLMNERGFRTTFGDGRRTSAPLPDDGNPPRTEDWTPPDALSLLALMRVIPALPREAGDEYLFDAFESEFLETGRVRTATEDEPFRIVCHGPETISVGSRDVRCVRYSVELDNDSANYYVDARGVVRAVDREMRLTRLDDADATAAPAESADG